MKTFKQYIDETYRITPKRREFLNKKYSEAKQKANDAFDIPDPIGRMHSAMYHSATQARIDAIRDMGLPADKRTTFLGTPGPDDAQLKHDMKVARITQQGIMRGRRNAR